MNNREMNEMTQSFARLTDLVYSAGMDEESEELQEIWNKLVSEIDKLSAEKMVLVRDNDLLESTISELERLRE